MASRYDRYSAQAQGILYAVQGIVRGEGRGESELADLARALLVTAIPDLIEIAVSNDLSLDREKLKALSESLPDWEEELEAEPIKLSQDFRAVLDRAEESAAGAVVEPIHIIHAAWEGIKGDISLFFAETDAPDAAEADEAEGPPLKEKRAQIILPELQEGQESVERRRGIEFLQAYGRELVGPEEGSDVFGREKEIESLLSILSTHYKPKPLLIGESGVGKTAIVEGLALRIKAGRVPARLKNARIFEIKLAELASGNPGPGALEERMRGIIQAVEDNPDILIFFDDIHALGQGYASDQIADILKPALSRRSLRCLGAATLADYHRHIERDEGLTRRFQTILVKEPGRETLLTILEAARQRLEKHYELEIPAPLLDICLGIAKAQLRSRRFPDKALDLLDRASSRAAASGEKSLTEARLRQGAADIANLGHSEGASEGQGIEGLEERLKQDVLGQDDALARLAAVLRVCKQGLDLRPERPDGAFLFTGPTGVGKTALAESLAKRLCGRDDALFRIDMSEFTEAHSVARLLGAPPGYIGYGDTALLGLAAEKNPSGVLLLDEFEKAHPQVHRLFLQILDSGRATDSYGKTLSFSDMTIIATCNVNDDSAAAIGFKDGSGSTVPLLPMAKLKQVFPPELLNRFDDLIPFRALSRDDCRSILVELLIQRSNEGLKRDYGFEIEYDTALIEAVLEAGYSPEFGARELQRAFQSFVILPLAQGIERYRGRGRLKAELEGCKATFH